MMFSDSGQASKQQGSIKKHNSELFGVLLQVYCNDFLFFNMIFMFVVYVFL